MIDDRWLPREWRRRIYTALAPLLAVLVAFNVIGDDDVAAIMNIVGLLLGTGGFTLARVNTPKLPAGEFADEG